VGVTNQRRQKDHLFKYRFFFLLQPFKGYGATGAVARQTVRLRQPRRTQCDEIFEGLDVLAEIVDGGPLAG
jgi:hypothetical protein